MPQYDDVASVYRRNGAWHVQYTVTGDAVAPELRSADPPIFAEDKIALFKADAEDVQQALAKLPPHFREVIVLREMNQLNYRDIAEITNVPIGTVIMLVKFCHDPASFDSGLVKAYALSTAARSPELPQLPTVSETRVKNDVRGRH